MGWIVDLSRVWLALARACTLLGIVTLGPADARAQDWDRVEVSAIPVAPGVHMLIGRGGNIGVVSGPDGVFLIDDQFAPLAGRIREAVSGITDGPVRFVLNTHWHGDHTGGNEAFGEGGALLVAHENVRVRLSVDQVQKAFNRTVPAAPDGALPVVTFEDSVTFHWNEQEIRCVHVPKAHTDGDSFVHVPKANVIHTGDVYFNGFYPFIDLESDGSLDGTLAAVDRLLELADATTRIIPGHGPLSNRAELEAYRSMLAAVRERISASVAAGKTLDEVLAEKPTSDLDPEWGDGFVKPEAFVRTVYTDLARQAP